MKNQGLELLHWREGLSVISSVHTNAGTTPFSSFWKAEMELGPSTHLITFNPFGVFSVKATAMPSAAFYTVEVG